MESIPGKITGAWVFKGTRTPVAIVFENLEDGMTIDEVLDEPLPCRLRERERRDDL